MTGHFGQKVKLPEHYFQLVLVSVAPIVPVGSYHRSMKLLVH